AKIEERYSSISESTVEILFLGTPHRGSKKAGYGKALATLATTVLNKPSPRLVNALQVNSEALMRLTTDFRFQLSKYEVCSSYETTPMKMHSNLVVEKHSALLEIDVEEQIPVNANHEEMYVHSALLYNKRYCIPHNLSAIFTGRNNIIQEMYKGCLATNSGETVVKQKRFVVYGLGGSGKTQACIKFAQYYRERFWGIFWIDASSQTAADQGFLEISRICGIDKDPKVVRQWLSNIQESWLLIIDNADDPSVDVSKFFPTGNRGSILLTTRNPDCRIHSTIGLCELGQMNVEEAITLLLKATGAEDVADKASRKKAFSVTQTIGFLAIAIVQAGTYIRQGLCGIEEYCDFVYTTWEISIAAIEKMGSDTSHNAELLRVFCFLHYDGISEEIFEQAWSKIYERGDLPQDIANVFYMQPQQQTAKEWDPATIREAAVLLASFSLI
ncbi:hypothetical protein MMC31_002690, partial [Peltigera leucophlebia]|nr:hypothetical protein [Peltigera leucophlebia]